MTQLQRISRDELQAWLLDRLAFYLDKPADTIDPNLDLGHYGVDSVYAISIISDIEDLLQIEVDISTARQQRTVHALTDYTLDLVG